VAPDDRHADLKLWAKREFGDRLTRVEKDIEAATKALELQAREYNRRLEELNHAHAKHEQFVARFPSNEKFEGYVQKMDLWQNQINQTLAELKGSDTGKVNLRHVIFESIAIIIAAFALWLAFSK
jgi:chromosome segregation ATPase